MSNEANRYPESNASAHDDLCICGNCGYDRVQPTGWSEVDDSHWHITLRCPDCEVRTEGTYTGDVLDTYDAALDEGTRSVASDLDLLARANFADEMDRFVKALAADYILPQDLANLATPPQYRSPGE